MSKKNLQAFLHYFLIISIVLDKEELFMLKKITPILFDSYKKYLSDIITILKCSGSYLNHDAMVASIYKYYLF